MQMRILRAPFVIICEAKVRNVFVRGLFFLPLRAHVKCAPTFVSLLIRLFTKHIEESSKSRKWLSLFEI